MGATLHQVMGRFNNPVNPHGNFLGVIPRFNGAKKQPLK